MVKSYYYDYLTYVFQVLFSDNSGEGEFLESEYIANFLELTKGYNIGKITNMVNGILNNRAEIDTFISKYLRNWTLNRLSKVDLNLLRLGIYELSYAEKPKHPKLIINNVVELAKQYGNEKSYKFVNAVLDNYYKNDCHERA